MGIALMRFLWLGTLSLTLIGCALSPQTVTLSPTIAASEKVPNGEGRRLSIEVVDLRATPLVGLRGGVYSTAEIRTSSSATANARAAFVKVLEHAGYVIVTPDTSPDIRMTVEIIEITYVAEGNELVRAVDTGAVVRAVSMLGNKTVTRTFRVSSRKEVIKAPSEEENVRLLNTELSNAFNRVVTSEELFN